MRSNWQPSVTVVIPTLFTLAAGMRIHYAAARYSNDIRLPEYAGRMRAEIRGALQAGHLVKRYSWRGAMAPALASGLSGQWRIIA